MKEVFFRLKEEKQKRIIGAAINEFAKMGYDRGSLNVIVKEAGISKGGLFKYIDNKKELFLFLFEEILIDLLNYQKNNFKIEDKCFIERTQQIIRLGFDYYEGKDKNFKFMMNALADTTSEIFEEVTSIKSEKMKVHGSTFFINIDWNGYYVNKDVIIETVDIIIKGFNQSIIENTKDIKTIADFKIEIELKLNNIMNILKYGIMEGNNVKI